MKLQRTTGDRDRLTDLPEPILLHILSMLESKEVVRTSVLSSQWRFIWKSVPMSVSFHFPKVDEEQTFDFLSSIYRDLIRYRSYCKKIQTLKLFLYKYDDSLDKHIDFWVDIATKPLSVEDFTLKFSRSSPTEIGYKVPEFAYRNAHFRNLVLDKCQLNPSGIVNWISLVSLSIGNATLREDIMEKILSGCPNLECLELDKVLGIRRLEISSVKLRKLIITNYRMIKFKHIHLLEVFAPYIQHLELLGFCRDETHLKLKNVSSLVTAVLSFNVDFVELRNENDRFHKQCEYWQELLQSIAHVKNLELGPWCIQCLSILESKGWLFPPSRWKFLKLNAALEQLDYPGVCTFLLSSPDLETLVFDWNNPKPIDLLSRRYLNEDEQSRRFEAHYFNCSLLHLKTIKFINFNGKLSENKFVLPLVKYLLKNAIVLKKFVLACKFKGSDVSQDYAEMEQEFLSLPRSSLTLELSLLIDDSLL